MSYDKFVEGTSTLEKNMILRAQDLQAQNALLYEKSERYYREAHFYKALLLGAAFLLAIFLVYMIKVSAESADSYDYGYDDGYNVGYDTGWHDCYDEIVY